MRLNDLVASSPWMRALRHLLLGILAGALCQVAALGVVERAFITSTETPGAMPWVTNGRAAPILLDQGEPAGVLRAVRNLGEDVARVTMQSPPIQSDWPAGLSTAVVIGTIGRSRLIDELIAKKRIDVTNIQGHWEAYGVFLVPDPAPSITQALVIVGSDKRGTIFGTYTLSEQIGVSPWHWWADVPPQKREALFISSGTTLVDQPEVKYRGIFINDEAPALSGWALEKFGGFNHRFYERVFELLLRLKANYLWPAMWAPSAFNEDDPLNPALADEFGIVMGTSHHEPMLRSQQEWKRHGTGAWDYRENAASLRDFWRQGIRRNRDYESVFTVGMRGDGDRSIPGGQNLALMQRVIADQRTILTEELHTPAGQIPQVWALYKEVQDYYDKGLVIPEDVTLLFCDDNFGNLRRLPSSADRKRPGGSGIYYHFDYFGGPRSYMWLNTVPLAKIAEQMHRAYNADAKQLWIVNVGDIKPLEFPIDFFLTMAWSPGRWPLARLQDYAELWAKREFGAEHAKEIARLIVTYPWLNSRKKPEQLTPETYSLINHREAESILGEYRELANSAEALSKQLNPELRDAFFQLLLYPIQASALAVELNITAGRNRLYANQGRASTNVLAQRVRDLFHAVEDLTDSYHTQVSDGKWKHLMDQPFVGSQPSGSTNEILSTEWRSAPRSTMPPVTELHLPAAAELAVAVEGNPSIWVVRTPMNFTSLAGFEGQRIPTLPPLSRSGPASRWVDVINRGKQPLPFRISAHAPWLTFAPAAGTLTLEQRVEVGVSWALVPEGTNQGSFTIEGPEGQQIEVTVPVTDPARLAGNEATGFVEIDGHVAIHARSFAMPPGSRWRQLDAYGRTGTGICAREPGTLSEPPLECQVLLSSMGRVTVEIEVTPSLPVLGHPLRCAIAFDDQEPQLMTLSSDEPAHWKALMDSVEKIRTTHQLTRPGQHTLRFWALDPEVVLQKVTLLTGPERDSFFGPPPEPICHKKQRRQCIPR